MTHPIVKSRILAVSGQERVNSHLGEVCCLLCCRFLKRPLERAHAAFHDHFVRAVLQQHAGVGIDGPLRAGSSGATPVGRRDVELARMERVVAVSSQSDAGLR